MCGPRSGAFKRGGRFPFLARQLQPAGAGPVVDESTSSPGRRMAAQNRFQKAPRWPWRLKSLLPGVWPAADHRPGRVFPAHLSPGCHSQRLPVRRMQQRPRRPQMAQRRALYSLRRNQRGTGHPLHLWSGFVFQAFRGQCADHAPPVRSGWGVHHRRFLLPGPLSFRGSHRPGGGRSSGCFPLAHHLQPHHLRGHNGPSVRDSGFLLPVERVARGTRALLRPGRHIPGAGTTYLYRLSGGAPGGRRFLPLLADKASSFSETLPGGPGPLRPQRHHDRHAPGHPRPSALKALPETHTPYFHPERHRGGRQPGPARGQPA